MPAKAIDITVSSIEFEADGVVVKQEGTVLENRLMRRRVKQELWAAQRSRALYLARKHREKLKRHNFG